jgi:hypothetical protein
MNSRWSCLAALVFLSTSWSEAAADQPLTLGSGKSVDILAAGPLQSTHGWTTLILKYRTLIPLGEDAELRREVDEIWDRFVVDVERDGYQTAVITANEPTRGVVATTNKFYGFVFEKRGGSWRAPESAERVKAKLDPAFVTEFLGRLDWLIEHNEMNAAQLYMANGWTATIAQPGSAAPPPQIIDRNRFVAVTHQTFAVAKNLYHHRDITDIAIGDNGTTARVESRETEEMDLNDRHIAGIERSTDSFELQGDAMQWTKTTSIIENQTETRSN